MNEISTSVIAVATVFYTIGTFLLWRETHRSVSATQAQVNAMQASLRLNLLTTCRALVHGSSNREETLKFLRAYLPPEHADPILADLEREHELRKQTPLTA